MPQWDALIWLELCWAEEEDAEPAESDEASREEEQDQQKPDFRYVLSSCLIWFSYFYFSVLKPIIILHCIYWQIFSSENEKKS